MPEFNPDWVVKPGETLREWIEENNLTVRSAATACGRMDPHWMQGIIDGKRRISTANAGQLERGTGIPARLWLNLERAYRAGLAAGKVDATPARCPSCGGRGWHTAGGNDPIECGRCASRADWQRVR